MDNLYKSFIDYENFKSLVSASRLERFYSACNRNESMAIKLYGYNIQLSQAFYPILSLFEVFLRNTINNQLANYFSDPNWVIQEESNFMSDKSLKGSNFFLKKQIIGAKKKILKHKGKVTPGKVIAELSLGFWTSLFDVHHYKLLKGSIIHCFPDRKSSIKRKEINYFLNNIRAFRNRIYHNEPICFDKSKIDLNLAIKIKADIFRLLNWIGEEVKNYIQSYDRIDEIIGKGQQEFGDLFG